MFLLTAFERVSSPTPLLLLLNPEFSDSESTNTTAGRLEPARILGVMSDVSTWILCWVERRGQKMEIFQRREFPLSYKIINY